MSVKSNILPGLVLAGVIAGVSQYLEELIVIGGQHPISGVILAILIGILIKNTVKVGDSFQPGIRFALQKVLKGAIILLGLSLSFTAVLKTGADALIIILICVTAAISLTFFIGKKMGLPDKLAALIGIGCAICGSTAICAAAPAIEAEDEDVTFSVATITLFGVVAIFLYPIIGKMLLLTDMQFGTWSGIAVHETAQVIAAGFAYSDEAGKIATVVKLTRTVLLAPLVLIFGIIYARQKQGSTTQKVNYLRIFPWFVLGFIALAIFRTYGDTIWMDSAQWTAFLAQGKTIAKFLIVVAMAGVGLLTNFEDMKRVGIKPFIVGLIASVIMAVFSIILVYALGI
ncbi:conserved hypothetical integral membrane protein [Desulfonispora thiosulfatigenes DSM 11270]|uniref:Conserved hypothetical integral membrane protein n=1 Tax=Desulfonispora thiosulfatigenes DSM 11270 TaxID=656914 RepID=A0A1W1VEN8_DESTI|nr:YeiH family protein [Desulfonispora thiosulfatigenes]SMB91670.1 conserved hypothetical integral membrane protein [Desulfonispora thiosulfatigenes DSM 11270]